MPSRSIAEPQANGGAGGASRPESAQSEHGYLSKPLDLRGTSGSKPDNLDHGEELALEMDGEWFGDAQESVSSAAQKQHREPDSPAMTLLRSITKASADAIPGLSASALPWEGHRSRLRPREQYSRPGGTAGGSGGRGGDGSRSSPPSPGDFYRLPWYRRPLPSPRPSGAATALDLRRRHSMVSTPHSGLRPPSTNVEGSSVPVGAGAARSRTAARDPPRPAPAHPRPGQQAPSRHGLGKQAHPSGGLVAPMSRARCAAKASEPSPNIAPTVPPAFRSAAASAAAATTTAAIATAKPAASELVATTQVLEVGEAARGVGVVAGRTRDGARLMPGDKDVVTEGPTANTGVGVAVREVSGGEDSGEIRRLKAELDRLKREMAAMAAATAAATTPQPGPVPGCEFGTPSIEVTTPVPSEGRSAWQWAEGKPPGVSERPKSTRNLSRAVRADDSWMQRRRSGRYHHRRSSSESLANGFVGGVMASCVLPTPTSDGGSSGDPLSFNNFSGHAHHYYTVEALSPPRPSLGSVGEGPSPASGEKLEGVSAAAAETRHGRRGSSAREDRGGQSGSASVRPFPVFFPVQPSRGGRAETLAPALTGVPRDGSAVAAVVAESKEALEAAAATEEEKEDAMAKQVSSDSGELIVRSGGTVKRDGGDGGDVVDGGGGGREKSGVHDKVPAAASPVAVQAARCRERPSVGRARVWRWVLAQRTGNEMVRQALMTHGLPPLDRRHIWAAWAAVAKPEGSTLFCSTWMLRIWYSIFAAVPEMLPERCSRRTNYPSRRTTPIPGSSRTATWMIGLLRGKSSSGLGGDKATSQPGFCYCQTGKRVSRVGVALKLKLAFLKPTKSKGQWLTENPPEKLVVLPRATYRGRKLLEMMCTKALTRWEELQRWHRRVCEDCLW